MRKLIVLVILLTTVITVSSEAEGREMPFWVYGIDVQATQKYEGLFEVPQFEYMGGAFGDYVYVVTLITRVKDTDYYCVGIITSSWFDDVVKEDGYTVIEVDNNMVSLSYLSVPLIKVPFEGKTNE